MILGILSPQAQQEGACRESDTESLEGLQTKKLAGSDSD